MRVSPRILILSMIVGLIVLFGCGAPAATPAAIGTEPIVAPGATEGVPSDATEVLPTESIEIPATAVPSIKPTKLPPQPALPERRRLTVEFPPEMHVGDSDRVRLTLEVDDLGNVTPTAEVGGNVVTGGVVEIPNLYATHHVIAEARLDLAGMEVSPAGLTGQPLTQGTSVTFYWSIHPQEVGDYRGTIWLYLRFVDKSSGEESQKTVSAQIVDIQVVNLFGLSGGLARTTGVVGSIVGTIIGFPFLEEIIKFLFKKRTVRIK